jgi:CPA1 family monovalent cation:H+ antiporter
MVASFTLVLIGRPYAGGFREQAATLVSQIDFNQVVLRGMLAFLLFAGSIQVRIINPAMKYI